MLIKVSPVTDSRLVRANAIPNNQQRRQIRPYDSVITPISFSLPFQLFSWNRGDAGRSRSTVNAVHGGYDPAGASGGRELLTGSYGTVNFP